LGEVKELGLLRREGLQQPCNLQFTDFFLAELPHVLSAAHQITVASDDNGNYIPANVAFVNFSFFGHRFLLSYSPFQE
jgi:hypothetical protein